MLSDNKGYKEEKIKEWLGLAQKAGKIAAGAAQVEALIKKKKGYLLILAQDAPGLIRKFEAWGQDADIPALILSTKEELGQAVGGAPRGVMLVLDRNLAQSIISAGKNKSITEVGM
ncbi:MAG: ribosomal L7Ae/L30e/S12e/Gadd45 family protein [Peptococcaceae bacterium]|jgi:ribosomal protein L7Ae-like RNA K-turn-binding protein|nr:ribosomal L7Ae/L30e/S12e/Gadd45 family protein [Peptococcaceae bacterium]